MKVFKFSKNSASFKTRRYLGLTLIEIAIALVIIGILTGLGASLIGILTKRAKLNENREKLRVAYESVLNYATQNKTLPNSLPPSVSSDVFGNDFTYVRVNEWTSQNICTTRPANFLTVYDISEGSPGRTLSDIAFIIIAGGENRCNQTGTSSPLYIYPQGASGNCCPPHPAVPVCPAGGEYDDLVMYIDMNSLRQKMCNAFRIVTESLPVGREHMEYSPVKLEATDGTPSYRWEVISVQDLPGGISLSEDGYIRGKPTKDGSFPFTVRVTDAEGRVATKSLSITVEPNKPRITTEFLPVGYVGERYPHAELSVTGGIGGYTWSIKQGSSLPPGLSFNGNLIEGIPTKEGTYSITFRVTDGSGDSDEKTLSITIYPERSSLTLNPLSGTVWTPTVGQGFNQSITVSGGTPPYTNTTCTPQSCGGLTLSCSSGGATISGTYAGGSCSFSVAWQDSQQRSVSGTYHVNPAVSCPSLSLNPISGTSWDANVGQNFSQTISVSGGQAPLTNTQCSSQGTCNGLSINCGSNSAVISGTPNAPGTCTANVSWRDSCQPNQTISGTYTINITPACTPMSLSPPSGTIFNAYEGQNFSQTINLSGGYGAINNTFCKLACPAGVSGLNASCTSNSATISGTPYLQIAPPQECQFTATWRDSCPGNPQTITGNYSIKINLSLSQIAVIPKSNIYYKKDSDNLCRNADPRSCIVVNPGETISFYTNYSNCDRENYSCKKTYNELIVYDTNRDGNIGLRLDFNDCDFDDNPPAVCI